MRLAIAAWTAHARENRITVKTCGKAEFSLQAVCYTFVSEKFKNKFQSKNMWEDSRAILSALDSYKLFDSFLEVMRQEVVFSDARLSHDVQVCT